MGRGEDKDWLEIGLDAWLLGTEASMVVILRAARLAGGGPTACREAQLMVDEKVDSGLELGTALVTGQLGTGPKQILGNVISFYLAGVRQNRKRLARR